jgi:hypothetical protein
MIKAYGSLTLSKAHLPTVPVSLTRSKIPSLMAAVRSTHLCVLIHGYVPLLEPPGRASQRDTSQLLARTTLAYAGIINEITKSRFHLDFSRTACVLYNMVLIIVQTMGKPRPSQIPRYVLSRTLLGRRLAPPRT